jgi:hypothetical protein
MVAGVAGPAPAGASAAAASWTPASVSQPVEPAPATHSTVETSDVTCPSAGFCAAVGSYRTDTGSTTSYLPFLETYSAGAWHPVTVNLPSNAATGKTTYGGLFSVSCTSATYCVAIGRYTRATGGPIGLVETLSGATWTQSIPPFPPNAAPPPAQDIGFGDIVCFAAGSCVATGFFKSTSGGYPAMEATLSGGTWTAAQLPSAPGMAPSAHATTDITAFTCTSPTFCVAVGEGKSATTQTVGLIDVLSGTTWTSTIAPEPPNAGTGATQNADLRAVSCAAPGSCVAGGRYDITADQSAGLLDVLSGGTWTAVTSPVPGLPQSKTGEVHSIACTSPTACVAVGDARDSVTHYQAFIDTLSGSSWATIGAPVPATATETAAQRYSTLESVSCPAPGSCTAVGEVDPPTYTTGLVETLSNGVWTSSVPPVPSDAATGNTRGSGLYLVDCAAGGCAAAGRYTNKTGGTSGLLETYDQAPSGYFEAASDGGIFAFTVPFHGSEGGKPLNAPIVYAADDPLTGGYYEVASDGGIFAFTAPFHGSMGGKPLNEPIVGMAFDTRTGGYYLVASDGGLFAFTAPFLGSMGGKPLNQPIVGMAFDPTTGGYWEVAADGGLFAFTAPFHGSMGGKPLNEPIVGMTYDSLTDGYYEVATDGGLFAFTAPFHGSMGGKPLNEPVVGMAYDYGTGGYWEVASDGGLFSFTAPFLGSMGGKPLNEPIVTMALG